MAFHSQQNDVPWPEPLPGNEQAWANWLETQRISMVRQLAKLTHDRQLAEDLFQDTVLYLWEKRTELVHLKIRQPSAWLWGCLYNQWRAHHAKQQRRRELLEAWLEHALIEKAFHSLPILWPERLQQAIETALTPLQRRLLHLLRQGFPPRDIAHQLGLSPKQVHQQLYRSRQKLRPLLAQFV